MSLKKYVTTFVVLGFSFYSIESVAWVQIKCIGTNKGKVEQWPATNQKYEPVFDSATIPINSAQHAPLVNALDRMNLNPSNFRYRYGGMDNKAGVAEENGQSEISYAILPDAVAAVTHSDARYNAGCVMKEADIQINSKYRWGRAPKNTNKMADYSYLKAELFEYGGDNEHFRSVFMHEMGHAAGLDHEGDVMNLMGGDNLIVTNGSVVVPYVGEDTAAGLVAAYGLSTSSKEDISVSHWKWADKRPGGQDTFYSVSHRTGIFNTANQILSMVCPYTKPDVNLINNPISSCPEPVFKANRGQTVKLEFTYENSGKTTPLAGIARYYLSTDSTINSSDTLLKTDNTLIFRRDSTPATFATNITIPTTVTSGRAYWLGVIVDTDTAVTESFEGNNATYVGIKVN